jgi:hypothetical protein
MKPVGLTDQNPQPDNSPTVRGGDNLTTRQPSFFVCGWAQRAIFKPASGGPLDQDPKAQRHTPPKQFGAALFCQGGGPVPRGTPPRTPASSNLLHKDRNVITTQSQTSWQPKSNEAWNELCAITSQLAAATAHRDASTRIGRPEAFRLACRQNPELAKRAIDPTGQPVVPGSQAMPSSVAADPAEGTARPWGEVLTDLGIKTKSAAAKVAQTAPDAVRQQAPPASTDGKAKPWREILAGIEAER